MVLSFARASQVHSQVAPSSSEMMRPKLVARMMRWGSAAGTRICNESGKAPFARAGLAAATDAIKNAAPAQRPRTNDDLGTVGIVCWQNRGRRGALCYHTRGQSPPPCGRLHSK